MLQDDIYVSGDRGIGKRRWVRRKEVARVPQPGATVGQPTQDTRATHCLKASLEHSFINSQS